MKFNTDSRQATRSWSLPKDHAQTFTPNTAGILRIQSGRAWVTINRSRQYADRVEQAAIAEDDLFLDCTTSLPLQAGQAIVLEPWTKDAADGVTLAWEVAVSNNAKCWQRTVAEPAHEITQGLRQTGLAFTKVRQGLLSYTAMLLARPSTLR
jgi:hypothetical protein